MDSGNSGSSSGDDDDRSSRHQSFVPSYLTSSASASGFGHFSTATTPNPSFVTSSTSTNTNTNTNTGLFDPFLQHQQQPMCFGGNLAPGPTLTRPGKGMGVRSSKKRSRASRRAPTTVLTTDTSNFRAMVQEFTGVPAPPFSASPYSRLRSGHLDPLRPFAPPIFNQDPILSFLQQPHQLLSSLEGQIQAGQTTHHQVNAASTQHQLFTDNNTNSSSGARCDGTVDSWICPPR